MPLLILHSNVQSTFKSVRKGRHQKVTSNVIQNPARWPTWKAPRRKSTRSSPTPWPTSKRWTMSWRHLDFNVASDSEESASRGRLRRSDQPLKRPAQQVRLAHHQGRRHLSASEWRHDVIISRIRCKPSAAWPSDATTRRRQRSKPMA